ncbi:MAG: Flp family type IVb pilin [Actinobacteria bacterium]|nr:Flp family type IVb pilin [Actinomycetota bacterium]
MTTLTAAIVHHIAAARARWADEEGAAMVEYGLLVALIAVVVMAALTPLGGAIADLFNGVAGNLPGGTTTTTA